MRRFSILITLLTFLASNCLNAQDVKYREFKNKDRKKFEKAVSLHKMKKTGEAMKTYQKLIKKYVGHPDLELWIGLAYKDQYLFEKSLPHLITATQNHTSNNSMLYSTIGNLFKESRNYQKAKEYYELSLIKGELTSTNKMKVEKTIEQLDFILTSLRDSVFVKRRPLAQGINTKWSEYLPQFTADESMVVFTRNINGQEDIFYARLSDSLETIAKPFKVVNTKFNEGAHTISADGQQLIFTHCSDRMGFGSCDLYFTQVVDGRWQKVKNLGDKINTASWDSQPCLSGDLQYLYFASNRTGGYGGMDIWYSVRDSSGHWSTPVNAGPRINTSNNEESPFIHHDLKTMYFRSNGHIGMGGYDIFMTTKDSLGQWTTPINAGYPINSEGSEGAFIVSLDGKKAFIASDFDGEALRGNIDIYEIDLPEKLSPNPCTYVKIRCIDKVTKKPIMANLEVRDIASTRIILQKLTDENGYILIPLPISKKMAFDVTSRGYVMFSDNLYFDSLELALTPYEKIIELEAIRKETKTTNFVLNNIFFRSGSSTLEPISFVEIEKVKKILDDHPQYRLKIIGHTDNVGTENENQVLSQDRADAVKQYLIQLGEKDQRISTYGYGESKPLVSNDSELGRRTNRRTEFVLY